MANVTVKTVSYGQWGNAVQLSNATVELVATLDFGPRIIRFGFVGGDNLFLEDKEGAVVQQGQHFAPVGGGEWRIYGGHRLWTSPEETPRSTYPDNDPVEWREVENGIVLTAPPEMWNQVQKEIEVRLSPDSNEVNIVHRVTNQGPWTIEFAPWALSVMAAGGRAIVPQADRETGLLANRVLTLWPYSKMNDERVCWGDRYILLKQDPAVQPPFKVGTSNEHGWAAYANNGNLFIKRFSHTLHGTYPDFGVSFEMYTNGVFLELETLGELRKVAPRETVTHEEVWDLFAGFTLPAGNDEPAIDAALKPYMRD